MKKFFILYLICQSIYPAQEIKESSKIVASMVAAGLGYEILKDQVTSRISPDYHTKKFGTKSKTKIFTKNSLKILVPITLFTIAARAGSWPQLEVGDLVLPTGLLLSSMAVAGSISGIITSDNSKKIDLNDKELQNSKHVAFGVPKEKLGNFYVSKNVDFASNAVGAVGSIAFIGWILRTRYQEKLIQDQIEQMKNETAFKKIRQFVEENGEDIKFVTAAAGSAYTFVRSFFF